MRKLLGAHHGLVSSEAACLVCTSRKYSVPNVTRVVTACSDSASVEHSTRSRGVPPRSPTRSTGAAGAGGTRGGTRWNASGTRRMFHRSRVRTGSYTPCNVGNTIFSRGTHETRSFERSPEHSASTQVRARRALRAAKRSRVPPGYKCPFQLAFRLVRGRSTGRSTAFRWNASGPPGKLNGWTPERLTGCSGSDRSICFRRIR